MLRPSVSTKGLSVLERTARTNTSLSSYCASSSSYVSQASEVEPSRSGQKESWRTANLRHLRWLLPS